MSYKYRIIGAIIGFLIFNIIGAIIGYLIGQSMDEDQYKQKYKIPTPTKKASTSTSISTNTTKRTSPTLKSTSTKSNATQSNDPTPPSPSNTKQFDLEKIQRLAKPLAKTRDETVPQSQNTVCQNQNQTKRTRSHLEEMVQQELALGKLKSNDLKPNWKSYLDIIQRNNVSCLYHFTATKNINQIKKSGGLLSWYAAEQLSVGVPVFGGDSLSRNLDRRFGNHDYVHLSLCDDHPMAYRLKQNGEEVVILKINPIVAVLKDTIFSDINAADRSHQQGGDIEDLKRINFEATKMRFVSRDDPNFKLHQAEVMVKRFLPARYIENLNSI